MIRKVKLIELFAGIGCQKIAFDNKNIPVEVVGISEKDSNALKSYYAIHGDNVINFGDITKVESLPYCDICTYSFPCTDMSISGNLGGMDEGSGTKSSLIWEVKRLLIEGNKNGTLPRYLIMENVKNITSKNFIPQFNKFCDFLSSIGYTNSYKVLSGVDFGIPQNRERVFMVSVLNGDEFVFPEKIGCHLSLIHFLEADVDESYNVHPSIYDDMLLVNNYGRDASFSLSKSNKWSLNDKEFTIIDSKNERITTTINEMSTNATFWKNYRKSLDGGVFIDMNKLYDQDKDRINVIGVDYKHGKIQQTSRIRGINGVCNTIPASAVRENTKICYLKDSLSNTPTIDEIKQKLVIRHMTERETWRLMGIGDEAFNKAFDAGVPSNQLYKQAGNGIIVNVFEAIVDKIYKEM